MKNELQKQAEREQIEKKQFEKEQFEKAEILQTRIPEAIAGIQVNFCKNPKCRNFGKPASTSSQPRGRYASSFQKERDDYTLRGDKLRTALVCHSCHSQSAIKSNRAIKEELDRISAYLAPNLDEEPSCPVKECSNHTVSLSDGKKHYQSFGKTKAGSLRYRCKACGKTFSLKKSTINRQVTSHKNALIFSLLMNGMAFRRISFVTKIGMWSLFKKIDFIHKQCMAFAASRERKLFNGDMPFERMYIAVDRQVYTVNYSDSQDETNICMPAVCSADNTSGYVFGLHLNYDPSVDREKTEYEAEICGDYLKPIAHRRFARLWMSPDYELAANRKIKEIKESSPPPANTAVSYDVAGSIEDPESFDDVVRTKKPRKYGMQVHAEYTTYAHFRMLEKLCRKTELVRLFIDQDTPFEGASMSAFYEKIMGGNCDVFYVRIKSEMPIFAKKTAVAETKAALNRLAYEFPHYSLKELKHLLIKERMENLVSPGNSKEKWLIHPIATMNEPERQVCFLTDDGKYDKDHVAHLYAKASLQGIDKVFNQIRSYISVLSRTGTSSLKRARLYFPESAYNPERIIKLLDIFRVYHNYHLVSEKKVEGEDKKKVIDKRTPAMRLGLAKSPIPLEDILYYKP